MRFPICRLRRSLLPAALLALAPLAGAQQSFTPSANGVTVEDAIAGLQTLVWQRCAEGMTWNGTTCSGTYTPMTWVAALAAANAANREPTSGRHGHSDWYVPIAEQLGRLWRVTAPAGVPPEFPETPATAFVSGTVAGVGALVLNALGKDFGDGSDINIGIPVLNPNLYAVRLVRAPGATYHTVTGTIQPAEAASWVGGNTFRAPAQGAVLLDYTLTPGWRYTGVSVDGSVGPSCVYSHITAPTTGVVVGMLQSDCTATLTFERITWPVTVTPPPAGQGTISCPATVPMGDTLVCTASALPGFAFDGWSDACAASGRSPTCTVAGVSADLTVSARFRAVAPVSVPAMGAWGLILLGWVAAATGARCLRHRG